MSFCFSSLFASGVLARRRGKFGSESLLESEKEKGEDGCGIIDSRSSFLG